MLECCIYSMPYLRLDLETRYLVLQVTGRGLNNRELDKLVAALGRSKATWRRALMLHDWLQSIGHHPDDRLCTTLIRHVLLL